jgi:hypothetical protein
MRKSSVDRFYELLDLPVINVTSLETVASYVIFCAGEHMKDDIPAAYNLLVRWDIFS